MFRVALVFVLSSLHLVIKTFCILIRGIPFRVWDSSDYFGVFTKLSALLEIIRVIINNILELAKKS